VHITKILGNGNIMGRSSIIAKKGALFTATAITDTLIYSFDKKILLKNIQNNRKFKV
jgi:signal-transduction protein with cAMP-binding, CBS, and nucleotidyltransferase domain